MPEAAQLISDRELEKGPPCFNFTPELGLWAQRLEGLLASTPCVFTSRRESETVGWSPSPDGAVEEILAGTFKGSDSGILLTDSIRDLGVTSNTLLIPGRQLLGTVEHHSLEKNLS